ncbi:hypothetical protein HG530_006024 [Fusarium avenaceum]|nr:hypothetical protein HG530_006024 [Fusarium avenaceum]
MGNLIIGEIKKVVEELEVGFVIVVFLRQFLAIVVQRRATAISKIVGDVGGIAKCHGILDIESRLVSCIEKLFLVEWLCVNPEEIVAVIIVGVFSQETGNAKANRGAAVVGGIADIVQVMEAIGRDAPAASNGTLLLIVEKILGCFDGGFDVDPVLVRRRLCCHAFALEPSQYLIDILLVWISQGEGFLLAQSCLEVRDIGLSQSDRQSQRMARFGCLVDLFPSIGKDGSIFDLDGFGSTEASQGQGCEKYRGYHGYTDQCPKGDRLRPCRHNNGV